MYEIPGVPSVPQFVFYLISGEKMGRPLFVGCFVIVLCTFALNMAEACTVRHPPGVERSVPAGSFNSTLLDAAIRAEVNYVRCQAGRRPLRDTGRSLVRIAEAHSRWMIQAQNLSHRSNVRGRARLIDRARAAGLRPRRITENIGYVNFYQLDGRRFNVVDASSCHFATSSGQRIPKHSYATLARSIVTSLMNSPSHRRNILDPQVGRVSTGAFYDARAPHCGRVWFTQNFLN